MGSTKQANRGRPKSLGKFRKYSESPKKNLHHFLLEITMGREAEGSQLSLHYVCSLLYVFLGIGAFPMCISCFFNPPPLAASNPREVKQHHINSEKAAPKIGVLLSLRITSQQSLEMSTGQHKMPPNSSRSKLTFQENIWRIYEYTTKNASPFTNWNKFFPCLTAFKSQWHHWQLLCFKGWGVFSVVLYQIITSVYQI